MRFTTKTEYGLVCLVYMARHIDKEVVTIKDMVKAERYSLPYVEKILQRLRGAGIVVSHPGKGGGYSLAKPAAKITLKEIIEALEGSTFEVFCEPNVRKEIVCTHLCMCDIAPVWSKTKELLDGYYGAVTLDRLAGGEKENKQPMLQK